MSQSLVNESGGARTPLSGLIASLVVLVVVLFFSGLLRFLPQPVLAAIVLVAVTGLFKLSALRHLRRAHRTEYIVATAALLGVLCSGLLKGVLIGAVISLVLLIRRASRPHVAELGRIPGTNRFSDRERHTGNEPIPGVMIVRPESSLLYFNVENVCDTIHERVRAQADAPRLVLLDLSASPHVDLQSGQSLLGLYDELAAAGVRLRVVEARASVRDTLRLVGVEDRVGAVTRFLSVADAVDELVRSDAANTDDRPPDPESASPPDDTGAPGAPTPSP
jgi:MFS superfamily sulfate permease-like transporter